MKTICSVCGVRLDDDGRPGSSVSHGLCRRHYLETLDEDDLATALEQAELITRRVLGSAALAWAAVAVTIGYLGIHLAWWAQRGWEIAR